jgi:hypothetical protein
VFASGCFCPRVIYTSRGSRCSRADEAGYESKAKVDRWVLNVRTGQGGGEQNTRRRLDKPVFAAFPRLLWVLFFIFLSAFLCFVSAASGRCFALFRPCFLCISVSRTFAAPIPRQRFPLPLFRPSFSPSPILYGSDSHSWYGAVTGDVEGCCPRPFKSTTLTAEQQTMVGKQSTHSDHRTAYAILRRSIRTARIRAIDTMFLCNHA